MHVLTSALKLSQRKPDGPPVKPSPSSNPPPSRVYKTKPGLISALPPGYPPPPRAGGFRLRAVAALAAVLIWSGKISQNLLRNFSKEDSSWDWPACPMILCQLRFHVRLQAPSAHIGFPYRGDGPSSQPARAGGGRVDFGAVR